MEDVSKNERNQILRQNQINVRSLTRYENMGLKRKEIMACNKNNNNNNNSSNNECAIKVFD